MFWRFVSFFLLDAFKTTFSMEYLTHNLPFQNQDTFFDFQKRAGEASLLLPSCAPASVADYVSISLNMSAVCFAATQCIFLLIPFFKPIKTFSTSINTKNNIFTYTHLFCTFNKKRPLKSVYRNPTYTFFYDTSKN